MGHALVETWLLGFRSLSLPASSGSRSDRLDRDEVLDRDLLPSGESAFLESVEVSVLVDIVTSSIPAGLRKAGPATVGADELGGEESADVSCAAALGF